LTILSVGGIIDADESEQSAVCAKIVKPFDGYIIGNRGHGIKTFIFKHESCLGKESVILGNATQPVREEETKVCELCDIRKPVDRFNGKKRCIECWSRQLRTSVGSFKGH
jgi:hypothetical protein